MQWKNCSQCNASFQSSGAEQQCPECQKKQPRKISLVVQQGIIVGVFLILVASAAFVKCLLDERKESSRAAEVMRKQEELRNELNKQLFRPLPPLGIGTFETKPKETIKLVKPFVGKKDATKKLYARDEFRSLVMGRTKEETLGLLGRPEATNDLTILGKELWHYRNMTLNPVTNKADFSVTVEFQNGRVTQIRH